VKPNGLAFSPDEKILYIAISAASHDPNAPHHIRAFDVVDGKKLANSRVFCDIKVGHPGWLPGRRERQRVDQRHGVECYAPDGTLLGRINVPEVVANVTFGGKRRQSPLYHSDHIALCGICQHNGSSAPVRRPG
jgi:gluconolactonase